MSDKCGNPDCGLLRENHGYIIPNGPCGARADGCSEFVETQETRLAQSRVKRLKFVRDIIRSIFWLAAAIVCFTGALCVSSGMLAWAGLVERA